MTLRLNGSTSGYTEIDAPAVAGSNTLVLPTGNGTSGQVLTTNGSGALSWGGAGKILQVVNATYSTETGSSSSTFADTGLTVTITPTSSSSKILVLVNQAGCWKVTNNTYLFLRLLRGSTSIVDFERLAGYTNSTAANAIGSCSLSYLDSPATTSATIYKTQFASGQNSTTVYVQTATASISSASTITLMEVAA
jgi:hypothetical protein